MKREPDPNNAGLLSGMATRSLDDILDSRREVGTK
jgi:hypothetical protein